MLFTQHMPPAHASSDSSSQLTWQQWRQWWCALPSRGSTEASSQHSTAAVPAKCIPVVLLLLAEQQLHGSPSMLQAAVSQQHTSRGEIISADSSSSTCAFADSCSCQPWVTAAVPASVSQPRSSRTVAVVAHGYANQCSRHGAVVQMVLCLRLLHSSTGNSLDATWINI